jgi:hypothetical protein
MNICREMTERHQGLSMLVIQAPMGASLEVAQERNGDCLMKMESTGKGPIRVFNCTAQEVQEIVAADQ